MTEVNEKDLARFWAKVDVRSKDECWEWKAKTTRLGYGQFRLGDKLVLVHRVSAFIHGMVDSIAAKNGRKGCGLVLHRCDNRRCVNPDHLETGTQSKNILDAFFRLRKTPQRGEKHGSAKLTEGDVISIRKAYAEGGITQRELGEKYGISIPGVRDIIRKRNWRHI